MCPTRQVLWPVSRWPWALDTAGALWSPSTPVRQAQSRWWGHRRIGRICTTLSWKESVCSKVLCISCADAVTQSPHTGLCGHSSPPECSPFSKTLEPAQLLNDAIFTASGNISFRTLCSVQSQTYCQEARRGPWWGHTDHNWLRGKLTSGVRADQRGFLKLINGCAHWSGMSVSVEAENYIYLQCTPLVPLIQTFQSHFRTLVLVPPRALLNLLRPPNLTTVTGKCP